MRKRILTSLTLIVIGIILLGINFEFLSRKYIALLFGFLIIAIYGMLNKKYLSLFLIGGIIISYSIRQITVDYININFSNALMALLIGISFLISSSLSILVTQQKDKVYNNWMFYASIIFFIIAIFLFINNFIELNYEIVIKSIFPIFTVLVGVIMILRNISDSKKTL